MSYSYAVSLMLDICSDNSLIYSVKVILRLNIDVIVYGFYSFSKENLRISNQKKYIKEKELKIILFDSKSLVV